MRTQSIDTLPYVRIVNGKPQVRVELPDHLRKLFPSPRSRTGYKTALTRAVRTEMQYGQAMAEIRAMLDAAEEALRNGEHRSFRADKLFIALGIDPGPILMRLQDAHLLCGPEIGPKINHTVSMNSRPAYTSAMAIADWQIARKRAPKPKAVRAKAAKMSKLLTFLGAADDLTSVTSDQLQAYKEHLLRTGGNDIARDHLTDIRALFAIAHANRKFGDAADPAVAIRLPPKRGNGQRLAFSDAEAKTIIEALPGQPPYIEWPSRLAAALGTISEEVVDADTRDVERIGGMVVLHIRPRYRVIKGATSNQLKTVYRTRSLPLPDHLAERFWAYVESVRCNYGDGPLFPMLPPDRDGIRSDRSGHKTRQFMKALGVTGTPYSWRHRVASQLQDMDDLKADRARYITGHGPVDIHAKHYLEHPPHKLKPYIDRIPDPATF